VKFSLKKAIFEFFEPSTAHLDVMSADLASVSPLLPPGGRTSMLLK
jgi:hypothetical protein